MKKPFRILKQHNWHDMIKNTYCEINNIPLLRIPYWESNNIEQIILDYIKCVLTKQND